MTKDYILKLIVHLMKYGFRVSEGEIETLNEIVLKTAFFKYENGSMYVIRIIDSGLIDDDYFTNYKKSLEDYKEKTLKNIENNRIKLNNLFMITIFIGESNYYDELIKEVKEFEKQKFYNIYWKIDLENEKILASNIQPTKFAKIDRAVKEAFQDENDYSEKSVEEFLNLYKNVSNLKVRNENQIMFYVITFINVFMFVLMELNGSSKNTDTLIYFGGITPVRVFYFGESWRLFTSCFLHIGLEHLINNTLALYIFGESIEKYLGRFKFIIIYIGAGLVGSIVSLLRPNFLVAAGASGAIYGLIGSITALIIFSRESIKGFSLLFMVIYIISSIGIGVLTPGTGNLAHIGGFITGFIISAVFLLFEFGFKKKK